MKISRALIDMSNDKTGPRETEYLVKKSSDRKRRKILTEADLDRDAWASYIPPKAITKRDLLK
jgi:hypothetical protein